MALLSIKRDVDIVPGVSAPVVFHVSQNDVGTNVILSLLNYGTAYNIPQDTTVTIIGSASNGNVFNPVNATYSGSDVTFRLSEEMSSVAGPALCEAVLVLDDNALGTANFIINVEASPMGADVPPVFTDAAWDWMLGKFNSEIIPEFNASLIDAIDRKLDNVFPTDLSGKYLKINSTGHVEASDIEEIPVDATLSHEGEAADAKATGDALALKANESTIAPEFSESTAYTAGQYLYKNGVLYKFTSDHTGAWTGTDAEVVTVGGEVEGVKTALSPYRVNIVDPSEPFVHLYQNGSIFSAANFIYMLPVKVKPNTKYTVMQKSPVSNDFHVCTSTAYPAAGGALTARGTTSPVTFTTGVNDNYINIIYYNSRRDSSEISPDTLFVAEGEYEAPINMDAIDPVKAGSVTEDKLSAKIKSSVLTIPHGSEVTHTGVIISDEYFGNVHIESESDVTVCVSNENMLLRDFYETQTSKTVNGITFTVNDDGTITANGTATANATFQIRKSGSPSISENYRPMHFSCLTSLSNDYFAYSNRYGFGDHGYGVTIHRTGLGVIYIRINSGATVNNVLFKPMLAYGSVKKEYVPSVGKVFASVQSVDVDAFDGEMVITATDNITVTGYKSANKIAKEAQNASIRTENIRKIRKDHLASVCHRGYLTEAPENTIYAFRAAVEDDIEYLESDIQFTSDGVPVMFHDSTINRIVNGHTGTISSYTWAQVQEFDVYTYFQTAYPDKWKPEYTNARIMSLDEYLAFAKGVGKPSALEIKGVASDANIATVKTLIEKYKYADCIVWMGSGTSYVNILPIVADYPETVFLLTLEASATETNYKVLNMFDTGKNAIGLATNQYNTDASACREKNLILYAYTIDTLAQIQALDDYVTMAASNSINVHKVLKNYYLGN